MDRYTSEDIADLRDLVTGISQRYLLNRERVEVLEKQTLDMLHEIEFVPMDMRKMVAFCKRLKEVRQERRACKDENEIIEVACSALRNHGKLADELSKALGAARVREEQQPKRIYTLRAGLGVIGDASKLEELPG